MHAHTHSHAPIWTHVSATLFSPEEINICGKTQTISLERNLYFYYSGMQPPSAQLPSLRFCMHLRAKFRWHYYVSSMLYALPEVGYCAFLSSWWVSVRFVCGITAPCWSCTGAYNCAKSIKRATVYVGAYADGGMCTHYQNNNGQPAQGEGDWMSREEKMFIELFYLLLGFAPCWPFVLLLNHCHIWNMHNRQMQTCINIVGKNGVFYLGLYR